MTWFKEKLRVELHTTYETNTLMDNLFKSADCLNVHVHWSTTYMNKDCIINMLFKL